MPESWEEWKRKHLANRQAEMERLVLSMAANRLTISPTTITTGSNTTIRVDRDRRSRFLTAETYGWTERENPWVSDGHGDCYARREVNIPEEGDDRYKDSYGTNPVYDVDNGEVGGCWSSEAYRWDAGNPLPVRAGLHLPVLDVDFPGDVDPVPYQNRAMEVLHDVFRGARQWWVPSSTSNHFHVYIGADEGGTAEWALPWPEYLERLQFLANNDLVDKGWLYHSKKYTKTIVRKPWNSKYIKKTNFCMWCGQEFSENVLDDHEDACALS